MLKNKENQPISCLLLDISLSNVNESLKIPIITIVDSKNEKIKIRNLGAQIVCRSLLKKERHYTEKKHIFPLFTAE